MIKKQKVGNIEVLNVDDNVIDLVEKIIDQNTKIIEMNTSLFKQLMTPALVINKED